jgi:aspartyl-tRNA(Asn)/glutamyl-tRNA(Gln) amidotransferase subunit A
MHDFEVAGPIARSAEDIALAMSVLAGPDARDPSSLRWPAWRSDRIAEGASLRILYIPEFEEAPVDPEIAKSVADAVEALGKLGHRVEAGALPFPLEKLARIFAVVPPAGVAWLLREQRLDAELLTPAIRAAAESGATLAAADYVEALAFAEELKRALAATFEDYDAIVTPAAAALPWPAQESHPETIDGKPVGPRGHAVFTSFVNISGCPGIAVPCAPSRTGLPIGFQIVGAWGGDEMLVALAQAYAKRHPHHARRPPMRA